MYNGGDVLNGGQVDPTVWRRISGYIQVPAGSPIKWGTAEVTFIGGGASSSWIAVDNLTVTRVPRIPNVFAQASDTLSITHTGNRVRGGPGGTVSILLPGWKRGRCQD